MSRLEDMQIFVETVERAGFSAAAQRLGLSKQYVSARVAALEARLGARLLIRTTRKLSATPLGLEYFERARRVIAEADEADSVVTNQGGRPSGRLRLSAPMSYGMRHLAALLNQFVERCPEVAIDIDLNDRIADLVSEGYDMAVRVGVLPDSSLVARRLAPVRQLTVGSPDYLDRHGVPDQPSALRRHALLLYGHTRPVAWHYTVDGVRQAVAVDGRLRANNGELLLDGALRGLGLTQLPEFLVAHALRDGRLRTVLDDFAPEPGAAHVVYPSHRQPSAAVKALADYLCLALGPETRD
jgi:DNA-binding transcriptional LysR family regulator